ncbi:flagellar biosynthetic protein FliO [Domibacillus robiginosus]|uniref:flagellar biosynthetic protein FliO n=1 Tax=Domibacillus robiginosus TaxID=1071054 RepID=UPI00067AC74B|nr:flagellar biosynthetic protein FliO [Domibacillus robiginosus]
MNLFIKGIFALLLAIVLFSGNEIIAGAALSDKSSVQDCIKNPDSCEQEQPAENNSQGAADENAGASVGIGLGEIVRVTAALAFVVALLYFLLRFVNKKSRSYQESHVVHHLGGTPLGGSRSIQVVRVGERVLVLGVGEDVSLLKEIDDPDERAHLINRYEEQADKLIQPGQIVSKLKKRLEGESEPKESASFKQEFEQKISELKKNRQQAIRELADRERKQDE